MKKSKINTLLNSLGKYGKQCLKSINSYNRNNELEGITDFIPDLGTDEVYHTTVRYIDSIKDPIHVESAFKMTDIVSKKFPEIGNAIRVRLIFKVREIEKQITDYEKS